MSVHLAGSIFGELRQRYPELHIRLVDGFSGFINQWLTEDRLDIAILYDSQRSRAIMAEVLAEEDLLLFAHRRRARDLRGEGLEQDPVPVSALAELQLILPDQQHGLRRALHRAGAHPDPALLLEVDSLAAIRTLVEHGLGWSVLPRAALTQEAAKRCYILRDLGAPPLRVRLMVAVSPARGMTRALHAVLAHLNAMVARLQERGIMSTPAARARQN
jgi:LysR family nitrogen assimilation transcriptional regulator